MTDINTDTGLPTLPDDLVWRIDRANRILPDPYYENTEDLYLAIGRWEAPSVWGRMFGAKKKWHTIRSCRLNYWTGSIQDLADSMAGSYIKDLTEAARIVAREAALIGTYPPKRLSED